MEGKVLSIFAQKTVEIDGVTYTLQKMPYKAYLELNDRCTNKHGVLMKAPYLEELYKHCVISPKITMSDFNENISAGMELAGEIESFLVSKDEQNTNQEESEE